MIIAVMTSVRTSTPLKSWLFQVSICNCLNCVHSCEDHSLLDFKSAVQYMKHFIYHFTCLKYSKLFWKLNLGSLNFQTYLLSSLWYIELLNLYWSSFSVFHRCEKWNAVGMQQRRQKGQAVDFGMISSFDTLALLGYT